MVTLMGTGHQEQWASSLILGGGTQMGVVVPGPSSGYYTCPPSSLPQSRSGNGLGPPFILRSWALPSQGLQDLSNSCQLSPYQGPKVSQWLPYHLGCPSAPKGPGTVVVCLQVSTLVAMPAHPVHMQPHRHTQKSEPGVAV